MAAGIFLHNLVFQYTEQKEIASQKFGIPCKKVDNNTKISLLKPKYTDIQNLLSSIFDRCSLYVMALS